MRKLVLFTVLLIIFSVMLLNLTCLSNKSMYEDVRGSEAFSNYHYEKYPILNQNISYEKLLNMSKENPFALIIIASRVFPGIKDLLSILVIVTSLVFVAAGVCIIHDVTNYIRRRPFYVYWFNYYRRKKCRR